VIRLSDEVTIWTCPSNVAATYVDTGHGDVFFVDVKLQELERRMIADLALKT
jgi:hypothetical protein